jgi:hypothetical protein
MSEPVDFAIVGGGASGIYTAWRLAHATGDELAAIRARIGGNGPLSIVVHERSQRIGGRLLSASPPLMQDTPMELGGMRYLDNQPLVKGLVENKLNVGRHQQKVDQPGNFAWLRRKLYRENELCSPFADLPYGLTETERAVISATGVSTPAQLIFWAVFQEFPEINGMPPEKLKPYLRTLTVDGRPLYDVGFWNLLSRHLSHEGRELAITAIGYDVLGANANAVDIIAENFDFTSDSKYYLFDDGFEAVIWELAEQFRQTGGQICMGSTLDSFDAAPMPDGPDGMALRFEGGACAEARAIVLAIPQAAIKALRRNGPLLDPARAPEVQVMLNAVEGIPLYKLFVIYETPWWEEKWGLSAGRSLTDIPVRQCYYWATNTGAPSAIMAYNDQASASFWGGYQTGPLGPHDTAQAGPILFEGKAGDWTPPGDKVAERRLKNWKDHKAPHDMVMEMHAQLMEMHGVSDAPAPVDAAFMDWMNAPYGGAVHFWNPGYKSWEMLDRITQPVDGLNAFIVGEAYSTVQTWVEGVFQTAEIALQKRLGMAPPPWVPGDGGKAE